jgi:hypothetical protein
MFFWACPRLPRPCLRLRRFARPPHLLRFATHAGAGSRVAGFQCLPLWGFAPPAFGVRPYTRSRCAPSARVSRNSYLNIAEVRATNYEVLII